VTKATGVGLSAKPVLGLLGNIPGDEKNVPVIEDTAVDVQTARYIGEFNEYTASRFGLECCALRSRRIGPKFTCVIINAEKPKKARNCFSDVAIEIAKRSLKVNRGSLLGRTRRRTVARGEFLKPMIREANT